jgi:hypothetical protein
LEAGTRLVRLPQQAVRLVNHQILQVLQREPGRALQVRHQPARAWHAGRRAQLSARLTAQDPAAAALVRGERGHAPSGCDDKHVHAAGRERVAVPLHQRGRLRGERAFARRHGNRKADGAAQGLEDGGNLAASGGRSLSAAAAA